MQGTLVLQRQPQPVWSCRHRGSLAIQMNSFRLKSRARKRGRSARLTSRKAWRKRSDPAIAAPSLDSLHALAANEAIGDAARLLMSSSAARHRAGGLEGLMKDASVAAFPEEQAWTSQAADALASAGPRPGEVAVRSSPPRNSIRMAPQGAMAKSDSGWSTWERRRIPAASSSGLRRHIRPPIPNKRGGGTAAGNRFTPIQEENADGQVRLAPCIWGGRWNVGWIVVAVMIAMTATDCPNMVLGVP